MLAHLTRKIRALTARDAAPTTKPSTSTVDLKPAKPFAVVMRCAFRSAARG